jgi:hypothetical protein
MSRMSLLPRHCYYVAAPLALALLAGCSKAPSRIDAAGISSGSAAAAAIAEYDSDGDGAISGAELDKAPALKAALKVLDTNNDQKITADEIAAEIDKWAAGRVAFLEADCTVTMDGRPLAGATVTLTPEKFLGETVHPATGTTDRSGRVRLSVAPEFLPSPNLKGIQCGFYKVAITHPTQKIQAQFNTATTLGCVVSQSSVARGLDFKL